MRKLYSSAIWRVPTKEKKIFLTFDDGPIPEITPWVLATLKKHNARATFFCVGANIEKHAEIFQQIISEGHSIGNHTFNHLNGWKTKTKEYLENVQHCEYKIKVQKKKLFRPPYGKMKRSQFSALNSKYSIIMWDILTGDFDQTISEIKCWKNALTRTREGSIVVFHDSQKAKKNLFFVLPKFLEHFSREGYTFERL